MKVTSLELNIEKGSQRTKPFVLRTHRPEDLVWITQRHELYARQQGWDSSFETMIGQICADFERDFTPALERCWIAEMDGQAVGSIVLARSGEEGVGKLRLLLVEEQARGYGLGSELVDACHRFACAAGYRKMRLWTTDQQKEARLIYQKNGYILVGQEPVHAFGKDMISETWELELPLSSPV